MWHIFIQMQRLDEIIGFRIFLFVLTVCADLTPVK